MSNRSVMAVAEMAIENAAGSNQVFQTVNDAFEGFEVSEAHRLVSEFNWRTIATTNYDTFLETAYSDPKRRRQTLVRRPKPARMLGVSAPPGAAGEGSDVRNGGAKATGF